MTYCCLRDKHKIEHFLRKDPYLHIYSLGDLDDFFWPHTTWYGHETNGCPEAIALLYTGMSLPTLLALSNQSGILSRLLASIQHVLPDRFYAHFSEGLETAMAATHDLESHGKHYKMGLTDKASISRIDCSGVSRLSMTDLPAIQELYAESYPGNWFDPRMLKTDQYFGIVESNRLVSIAGIHVYSPKYKVAALGNITTLPSYRGKGYGRRVTARLCQSLADEGIDIGLNVKADNNAAISCYQRLGFETVAAYEEFLFQAKNPRQKG